MGTTIVRISAAPSTSSVWSVYSGSEFKCFVFVLARVCFSYFIFLSSLL